MTESKKDFNILFLVPTPYAYVEVDQWLRKKSIKRIPKRQCCLGVLELMAYLRKHVNGLNIQFVDIAKGLMEIKNNYENTPAMTYQEYLKHEIDKIDFVPDIVAVSILFSSAHNGSLELIKCAKKSWQQSIVVCGGNHATNMFDRLLKCEDIDYIVRGEAELSFTEFVKSKMANEERDITGILNRKKIIDSERNSQDGGPAKTSRPMKSWKWELSPLIEDLDEIPIGKYHVKDVPYFKEAPVYVMMSRGCIYNCTFCATKTVHGLGMRYKSKDRFFKEMHYLVNDLGFRHIDIVDDMVGVDRDQFFDMIEVLFEFKGKVKYDFQNALNVVLHDEEMLDGYFSVGVREIKFAIESGTEFTQKRMVKKGKGVDLEKARNLCKYVRKKGNAVTANFILGFPYETPELMKQTVEYVRSIELDWAYIFSALPLPGTRMFKDFCRMGVIDEDTFDFDAVRHGRRTFDTLEITAESLENFIYDTNIDINFFENRNFKEGNHGKAIGLWNQMVNDDYPYHVVGRYCRALALEETGEFEAAEIDFRNCVSWIRSNVDAESLFERYGDRMPKLQSYF